VARKMAAIALLIKYIWQLEARLGCVRPPDVAEAIAELSPQQREAA
jgi:hypothetical protein